MAAYTLYIPVYTPQEEPIFTQKTFSSLEDLAEWCTSQLKGVTSFGAEEPDSTNKPKGVTTLRAGKLIGINTVGCSLRNSYKSISEVRERIEKEEKPAQSTKLTKDWLEKMKRVYSDLVDTLFKQPPKNHEYADLSNFVPTRENVDALKREKVVSMEEIEYIVRLLMRVRPTVSPWVIRELPLLKDVSDTDLLAYLDSDRIDPLIGYYASEVRMVEVQRLPVCQLVKDIVAVMEYFHTLSYGKSWDWISVNKPAITGSIHPNDRSATAKAVQETLDGILMAWLTNEMPSDEHKELMIKIYTQRNYERTKFLRTTDQGTPVSASRFFTNYTEGGLLRNGSNLPKNFCDWVTMGVTYKNCKDALYSIGIEQTRCASGLVYKKLYPVDFSKPDEGDVNFYESYPAPADGTELAPFPEKLKVVTERRILNNEEHWVNVLKDDDSRIVKRILNELTRVDAGVSSLCMDYVGEEEDKESDEESHKEDEEETISDNQSDEKNGEGPFLEIEPKEAEA